MERKKKQNNSNIDIDDEVNLKNDDDFGCERDDLSEDDYQKDLKSDQECMDNEDDYNQDNGGGELFSNF